MLRAETFSPPSDQQSSAGVTYNPSCHASTGPLGIQYDTAAFPSNVEKAFNQTVQSQGLPYVTDLTCGDPAAAAPIANTRTGNTRNDACDRKRKRKRKVIIGRGAIPGLFNERILEVSVEERKKREG